MACVFIEVEKGIFLYEQRGLLSDVLYVGTYFKRVGKFINRGS
jgi:hypothetical protein